MDDLDIRRVEVLSDLVLERDGVAAQVPAGIYTASPVGTGVGEVGNWEIEEWILTVGDDGIWNSCASILKDEAIKLEKEGSLRWLD